MSSSLCLGGEGPSIARHYYYYYYHHYHYHYYYYYYYYYYSARYDEDAERP